MISTVFLACKPYKPGVGPAVVAWSVGASTFSFSRSLFPNGRWIESHRSMVHQSVRTSAGTSVPVTIWSRSYRRGPSPRKKVRAKKKKKNRGSQTTGSANKCLSRLLQVPFKLFMNYVILTS